MSRQPFNQRWAQSVETENSPNTFKDPGSVRIGVGWEGGSDKDAPPAGEENWWHNRVDSSLQDIERTGVMSWISGAIYSRGAPTLGSDGNYYESLSSNNSGNNPVSSSGYWRYVGPSFFTGHEPGDGKLVWHNNPPSAGWLRCDGSVVLRSSYQRLFSVIGTAFNYGSETNLQFRLPDSRGVVIRGFDSGRGMNAGRVFGSFEDDSIQFHNHYLPTSNSNPGVGYGIGDQYFIKCAPNPSPTEDSTATTYPNPDFARGGEAGSIGKFSSETRMKNITANYWIKY